MKILILSQYFWPESFIINDFVKNLVVDGHDVTVATGKPNYPGGQIFEGYTAAGVQTESYLGQIDVFRVPLYPRKHGGAKNLILNYFSFIFAGLFYFPWLLRKKKFDSIMVFAPSPIVQAIPAILLKWMHRAHLSIWVQDLWPESLSATNFIKNKFILKIVEVLVRMIYAATDTLFVQSQAFTEPVARYAKRSKIVYFPNCFDSESMKTDVNYNLPTELVQTLNKNFSFVFAGNLGTAQSLETIVRAAEYLSDLPNVKIIFVGSGSLSRWLENEIHQKNIKNIYLAGRFPMDAMPLIFKDSKVLLVTLKHDPLFELTIPSKIQAYMAAGKPILAALSGEGARVISEANAGMVGPAEDSKALSENMRQMYAMSEAELSKMSESAKEYFKKNFEMSTQVKYFISILKDQLKK